MPHDHKTCQKNDEKKRCIPKEGMPHAHKAYQKKRKRRKYSPYQKKNVQGSEKSYKGVPPPSTKNIHTPAHLD